MVRLGVTIVILHAFGQCALAQETPEANKNNQAISIQETIEELDNFVTQLTQKDEFSGTVLWAKNRRVLYSTARGLASKRFNVPNNLQTRFSLASLNKMFTATATMQLVEQKQLSLNDTLDQYLDESWLPTALSSKIEIQHLLSHSSGLGSYFTEQFFNTTKSMYRLLEDFKPLIATDTLKFEPGTGYRYSNNGMLLLGAVISTVSGEDYFNYVRRHIYAPTGMTRSGCYDMDQPIQNLAIGYNANPEKETGWENNFFWKAVRGGPAGGCYSTVEDMFKFATSLINYGFLNEENTALLYSPKPEFHKESYGFGFKISGTPDNRIVGHRGGFVGMSSNLDIFLDAGHISVVLSNYGGGSIPVYKKIRTLVDRLEGN